MKKRPRRKSQKPPPRGRRTTEGPLARPADLRAPAQLQYKVCELSTVDEGALERTVNDWVQKGWTFENVQFAMRESSKRPAMAFVFFTRELPPEQEHAPDPDEARDRLVRLSERAPAVFTHAPLAVSPHERLKQLAGEGDGEKLDEDKEPPEPLEWKTLEPDE